MKNIIKFSLIGALSIFSLAQAADIDTVTVTPNKNELFAHQNYPMRSDEFYKFKREYQLSNGMTLTLSMSDVGSLMYAQLNDQPKERIVATNSNTFLSRQSNLKMHINVRSDDEVSGEVYIPVGVAATDNGNVQLQRVTVSLK
jgi:hypothetical protein